MRTLSTLLVATLVFGLGLSFALAEPPTETKKPLFNTSAFRPQIVLHPAPLVTEKSFVTISGVIFSHTPIERVTVGDRTATIRDAEPEDLVKLLRAPANAADAPHRTYFEVPDAGLPRAGVNDLDVRATASDGRMSDIHRVTLLRLAGAANPKQ